MRNEIVEPHPRPNAVTVITLLASIAASIATICGMLRTSATDGAYKLTATDLIIIVATSGAVLVQLAAFLLSLKKSAHHKTALRLAEEMVADCKAQEEALGAETRQPKTRVEALTAEDDNVAEDDASEDVGVGHVSRGHGASG